MRTVFARDRPNLHPQNEGGTTLIKKIFPLLVLGLLLKTHVFATTNFLVLENDRIIVSEGDVYTRHAPYSTFKIAISLMGFNEGILIDEMHPEIPFKEGYLDDLDAWKYPQTPRSWIKNSCVWYSQVVMQQIGISAFEKYVAQFEYGNQDVSGEDALTRAWLGGSLRVSPEEQVRFIQKLLKGELSVSQKSREMTKNILFVENLPDGWTLYRKTGNGSQPENKKLQAMIRRNDDD